LEYVPFPAGKRVNVFKGIIANGPASGLQYDRLKLSRGDGKNSESFE
jgi:hypothetical protein